jgi:ParB/RepB/Spo0J family partition protein
MASTDTTSRVTLTAVAVAAIDASPDQNREVFDAGELAELAESILELGLLQPITVRPAGDRYVLVAGERRLRAVRLLGLDVIDAIVRVDDDDAGAALRTLAENMVRVDPGPLEEARGLAHTAQSHGIGASELAAKLGKSTRWVRDRLALLELADDVAHFVQSGGLGIGRAVLMAALESNRQRLALQAHEHGIGIDAFRALVGKLADDQAAESMFDTADFLRVDEYVVEAEAAVEEAARAELVREQPLGIAEIAELLDVHPRTVHMWRRRGLFPESELRCGGSPCWWKGTVQGFARETGRGPDRRSARTEQRRARA